MPASSISRSTRCSAAAPTVSRPACDGTECQSHVVFYVPDESGVNIARVLHARMDALGQYVKESAGDWQK